ncbi:hypothetical protein [Kaistella sp.]|uniref:hypothetical protein n=1 Tax=Kaistella sp. TaxID=2782235 RepID=UPI0035A07688
MRPLLLIFAFFLAIGINAQTDNSFSKGFREGYESTINDANLRGQYHLADERKCTPSRIYNKTIDKNADEKLYAEAYRCGVQQATSHISRIQELNAYDANKRIQDNTQINNNQNSANNQNYGQNAQVDHNQRQQNEATNTQRRVEQERNMKMQQNQAYYESTLQNMRNQQIQSQQNFQQELSNNLNSISSSLQAMQYNVIKKEIDRRLTTANNFSQFQSNKIEKLQNFYNQIPKSEFNKVLSGIFSASILSKKKYSFVNNQELTAETPVLVNIEDNVIKNIYLYGKEKMELDYPKNNPEKSYLSNGFVTYSDFKTLETINVVVLEPYTTSNPTNYKLTTNEVSYITLWTSNKDAVNKIIYIQELDKNGNIIREISAPINYAKNEKSIDDSFPKIPMNSNNKLLFFGEVTATPFGNFPLYPRMSKSDMNALKDGESRLVEIKKYRE